MTDDSFDDIVAGFYRAASGAMRWEDALVPFQRGVSALVIHLHAIDVSRNQVAFSFEASDLPAEATLDYIRTYHRIDPRANLVIGLQPGEWINCWEVFDDEFVAADPFYQEFLIPYGGRYVSGAKLLQDDSVSVILGVHRGHGTPKLDAAEMSICRRLGRHLADALVVHRDRMKRLAHGSLGMGLLAKLRAPLVLIDEQRRLQHVNPAAQALLMNDGAVLESGGRLYCRRSFEDNALLVGLRRVLLQCRSHPGESSADKLFLRATTTSGDKTLGLYLYALHPQNTLHAFGDQSLAMILFHERGEQLELDPFVVAAAFDLTPGEARVAVATAHGASPDQIASQYAVSVHTVRSQLRAIFVKTGTSRQSELVSQLAALPMAALGLGDG